MSRRYHNREPVFVGIANVTGDYGFNTNLTQSDQTALGHIPLNSATGPVFFGASRPKPPRARNTSSGVSSFVDANAIANLGDDWKITKRGKIAPRPGGSTLSKLVYVTMGSAKYLWRIPTETFTKVGGDAAGLGIQEATGNDIGYIGANQVLSVPSYEGFKPPRVRKEVAGEGGIDIISTFASPASLDNLPAGWQPVD